MLFMLSTSISLQLLALAASAFLFAWGLHKQGRGTGIAKFFGFITTIIALFFLVSSLYVAAKLWQEGRMLREGMQAMSAHDMQKPDMQPANEKPAPVSKKK